MNHKRIQYKTLLKIAFCIAAVSLIYKMIAWDKNVVKIPYVGKGSCAVFYEEMDSTMVITEIDSTDQYIYIEYSPPGIVAVYDWDGNYHCSYAFYTGTNGTVDMRCDGGMLYVSDHANYEFVFSGTENIAAYDSENTTHSAGWYMYYEEISLVVKGQGLYNLNGELIMHLPGRMK